MKYFILTVLLTTQFSSFSQDIAKGSCNCFERLTLTGHLDKYDFYFAWNDCFKEIYMKQISFTSPDSSRNYFSSISETLKDNCDSYNKALSTWRKMSAEKSKIIVKDKKLCKQIMQLGEFEQASNVAKARMSMQDSIQLVTWNQQGIYTKSKVVWVDDCVYRIIFIESTNPLESSIMKKGDEGEIRITEIKADEIFYEVGFNGKWFPGKLKKIK